MVLAKNHDIIRKERFEYRKTIKDGFDFYCRWYMRTQRFSGYLQRERADAMRR
jgi:hypothetical protein